LKRLLNLRQTIEIIQRMKTEPQFSPLLRNLQEEFTQLLSFVNEISVLHTVLTPENAEELLQQFLQVDRDLNGER
jgi:hypothetical protein